PIDHRWRCTHRVKVWRTLFSGNLCVQHFTWSLSAHSRAYSGNGPRAQPLYKSKSGYYEVLEVLPTATQSQIKTAYYKQSFTFHPDRNPGSEDATTRFSEISEAYTVLGNKGLRKKYDRGLLSLSDLTATPPRSSSSKDPTAGSTKQHRAQSVVGSHARGGVFDFDTFFKSHYGEQLQRQRDLKAQREEMEKRKEEELREKNMEKLMDVGVALLLVMACALVFTLK
uniref:DnaJ heat shock protein family (Hsp40) member C30 n=1 Tax=Gouania willdenowi TaxID=441366 RepID=A0A8C5GHP0_GOUWI